MTNNLLSSGSADIANSRAGPNADLDVDFREALQATLNRPLSKPPRTRFRRYLTPWATDLPPTISYQHRRRVGRLKLDLNQESFGEYPSIDDLTPEKAHLLNPAQIKENSGPGREVLHQVEDQESVNNETDRNGNDLGWPTEAGESQSHVGGPEREDLGDKFSYGLSSSHGEWISAKLKLQNSVKLNSKLRFTTLISSAITLNEPPETEKERSETVAKLQRRERKDQEARAAKAEKIRLKNSRDCAVCMDSFDKSQLIHPCHHYYCSDCLAGMPCAFLHLLYPTILMSCCTNFDPHSNHKEAFQSAFSLTSKSQFRCCRRAVPIALGTPHLPTPFVESYTFFELELSTKNPLYCSNTDCASFIPPSSIHGDCGICLTCSDQTCKYCRLPTHVGSVCKQDVESLKVLKLASKKGWRQCPGCGHLISKVAGCQRITCSRCYTQFCYMCGMGPVCTCHL